jgi:hypothetical protein
MRKILLSLCVLAFSASAAADIKIKTRNKFAGQAMESTVYIKGARQRSEMMGMTTILQCDQRRTIQLNDRTKMYMVSPLVEEEDGAKAAAQAQPTPAANRGRKGGIITMTTTLNDTGERKQMFGYEARHIKSAMSSESSPDACNQGRMRMETDGWYADLSPGLSCTAAPGMGMGDGGRAPVECQDAVRMRRNGKGKLGFPLQAITTMYDEGGRPTTMTTETVELSNATLDAKLFDAPAGYRIARNYMELMGMGDMGAMMSQAMSEAAQQGTEIDEEQLAAAMAAAGSARPTPSAAPTPAAQPAPAMAPKPAGSVRIGVVTINDKTGRDMPTDNLREKLIAEIRLLQMDAVPLESTTPEEQMREAREKSTDYILYTDIAALAEPGQPLTTGTTKRNPSPTDFHSQLKVKLISVARPAPVRLDTFITTSAPALDVDAVGEGITEEAQAITEEIRNPKPKGTTPTAKPAKKK